MIHITQNIVSLTQSSVISLQIIYRNGGLKSFCRLPKYLSLILII